VVVAQEMKEAVDRKLRDLAREGASRGLRLRSRGLDRDVDLPEEEGLIPVLQISGLGEREGEDIGGPVDLEEIAVQGPDPRVVGEHERDRGAREAEDPESLPKERPKSGRS